MAELRLGGSMIPLRLEYKAIRKLESMYGGKPFHAIFENELANAALTDIENFFLAIITSQNQGRTITGEQLTELIAEEMDSGRLEFTDLAELMKQAVEESNFFQRLQAKAKERADQLGEKAHEAYTNRLNEPTTEPKPIHK